MVTGTKKLSMDGMGKMNQKSKKAVRFTDFQIYKDCNSTGKALCR